MGKINKIAPALNDLISNQFGQFNFKASPPNLPPSELKDGYCNREFNRNCLGYDGGIKVVKDNLFSQDPEARKRALVFLGDLIHGFPSKVYQEEPELILELCRIARQDSEENVRIFAHDILDEYFDPRSWSDLFLGAELTKEQSLIYLIAEVFFETLQDPNLKIRKSAFKDDVLKFFRIHPQFTGRFYSLLKCQIISAKSLDEYDEYFNILLEFKLRNDEFALDDGQQDQILFDTYSSNANEEIKQRAVLAMSGSAVLIEVLMTNPKGKILKALIWKLHSGFSMLSRDDVALLVDPVIKNATMPSHVITAFELKLDHESDRSGKREIYLQAIHHPYISVSKWAEEQVIEEGMLGDFDAPLLRDLAEKHIPLKGISPVQLAIPKKFGHQIVTDPRTFGDDPKLYEMASLTVQTFNEPSYQVVLKSLEKLRKGKPRTLVLNFERYTLLRKTEDKPKRKHDAVGLSLPGKEVLYRHNLEIDSDLTSQTLIHELGHALMRAAYPIMPYTLGPMHDERHDHLYDEQTNFSNAWVEGVATAFEFIEEMRQVQNASEDVNAKPGKDQEVILRQTSTLQSKNASGEPQEISVTFTFTYSIAFGTNGILFDSLEDDEYSFADYSLYHKRRNEHFIGAVLATYLAPEGRLDPSRFNAFMDTLSNGGKCNRTQFGLKQFTADFIKEHPEERGAFMHALDKYDMMGLVPKKYLPV